MYYIEFYIMYYTDLYIIYDILLTRDSLHERLYKKKYINLSTYFSVSTGIKRIFKCLNIFLNFSIITYLYLKTFTTINY